ncbi:MAG TPA: CHAD domain-containing protein [Hyphomicrobiaceae bacterium]|nr:CHAD domain-containing protein [Hyphomicrobiaceae bacterium]
MAFKLALDRDLEADARRALEAQVEVIGVRLKDADPDSAVHEARKGIKRMRSLLRLIDSGLSPKTFESLNGLLRDIARGLAAARDEAALRAASADLTAANEGQTKLVADLERIAAALSTSRASGDLAAERRAARRGLAAVKRRLAKLSVAGDRIVVLSDGLSATYRRGRKALKVARASGNDDDYHELRKHVQAHWRQMKLVIEAWPEEFAARLATAQVLSANLGLDHDLSLLVQYIAADAKSDLSVSAAERVTSACRARQMVLRTTAARALVHLYCERTSAFRARMHAYLAAHDLTGLDDAAPPID